MQNLSVISKRILLAIGFIVAIILFILWYSSPIEYGTLPVNITIHTLDGQASSRSLPLQVVFESEVDIANSKVEITLPDDILLLGGELSGRVDLAAHEPETWTLYVEPKNLGLATITVTVSGKTSPGKTQTASTALYVLSKNVREDGKMQIPLEINVTVFPDPTLGEVVQIHSLVTALYDSPNSTLEIILPEGLTLVDGDLLISGDLAAGETLELTVGLRVNQEGELPITITASKEMPGGGTAGRNAHLYFQIGTSEEYTITQFPLADILASGTTESIAEDEGVYYPPKETPPDNRRPKESGRTTESTGGELYIYGYWKYKDKDWNTIPIPWAKVEIWDANTSGDVLLGRVYTEPDGYYEATFFNEEPTGYDIYAIIHSPHFS